MENVKILKTSTLMVPEFGDPTHGVKDLDTHFCVHLDKKGHLTKNVDKIIMGVEWTTDNYQVNLGVTSNHIDEFYLEGIIVTEKGKGLGTELLNNMLDHCDNLGKDLRLIPMVPDDATMLCKKYNDLFDIYGNSDIVMSQMPKYLAKAVMPRVLRLRRYYSSFGFTLENDGTMIYKSNK